MKNKLKINLLFIIIPVVVIGIGLLVNACCKYTKTHDSAYYTVPFDMTIRKAISTDAEKVSEGITNAGTVSEDSTSYFVEFTSLDKEVVRFITNTLYLSDDDKTILTIDLKKDIIKDDEGNVIEETKHESGADIKEQLNNRYYKVSVSKETFDELNK